MVQVWSDPDRLQVPRCNEDLKPESVQPASPTALDFLLSPVGALFEARSERANAGGVAMKGRYCGAPGHHYAAFSLGSDRAGVQAPLNWVLPRAVRQAIATPGLAGFPHAGNEDALKNLAAEWSGTQVQATVR